MGDIRDMNTLTAFQVQRVVQESGTGTTVHLQSRPAYTVMEDGRGEAKQQPPQDKATK